MIYLVVMGQISGFTLNRQLYTDGDGAMPSIDEAFQRCIALKLAATNSEVILYLSIFRGNEFPLS